MKTLILASMMLISSTSLAMRCGSELVSEGDTVSNMIALCGTPQGFGQDLRYLNKDSDGMNYYIHASGSGIIDSIKFSRSGLR